MATVDAQIDHGLTQSGSDYILPAASRAPKTPSKERITLKNLKSAGVEEPWQVPLYLPTGYLDARLVYEDFGEALPEGRELVVCGALAHAPETEWRNGVPLTRGTLSDPAGHSLGFSLFGDSRDIVEAILESSREVYLRGVIKNLGGRYFLNQVALMEDDWIGRVMPLYPGKAGKLKPDTARHLIHERLAQTLSLADAKLRQLLADLVPPSRMRDVLRCPRWTLREVLEKSHLPLSPDEGRLALSVLDRIAAALMVADIRRASHIAPVTRSPLSFENVAGILSPIPFPLTSEQRQGIDRLIEGLRGAAVTSTLINGDVGMGKSIVYQASVAYVARAGGRVAVLLPHARLAAQAREEIASLWPDLDPLLVSGQTKPGDLCAHRVLVGTTALLHRDTGALDLVVIDEQHRFSVEQRQRLADQGSHLIELSATPIPRTQALLRYGATRLITLTQRHSEQDVRTFVIGKEQIRQVLGTIRQVIEKTRSRILVVCAMVESREDIELSDVETVFGKWHALFPGLVRRAHSRVPEEESAQVFEDLKSGAARILVCSSIVETGLNLPDTRTLIVVNADRFGVSQLHQLRGRLSRSGGWGCCYLYVPHPIKDETRERLEAVASTNDGFKLSQLDLEMRGAGDLSTEGKKQHGSADQVIFNRVVPLALLDEMISELDRAPGLAA